MPGSYPPAAPEELALSPLEMQRFMTHGEAHKTNNSGFLKRGCCLEKGKVRQIRII